MMNLDNIVYVCIFVYRTAVQYDLAADCAIVQLLGTVEFSISVLFQLSERLKYHALMYNGND
jgi:hypothetical protein